MAGVNEKGAHLPNEADGVPAYDREQHKSVAMRRGSVAVGEAADLYGDIQTAEEYGYVSRG